MTYRPRPVSIRQLPENLDRKQERVFAAELECDLNGVRPAMVFDCSVVSDMNPTVIHLLLCCLEEAMKRNGDVRLSGVSPEARLRLERAGADRLFRIFPTIGDPVESFHRHSHIVATPMHHHLRTAQEHAA